MIKNIITKKVLVTSIALFALLLIYMLPNREFKEINIPQELEYVNKEIKKGDIFLLDKKGNLGKTKVVIEGKNTKDQAKELLEILITSGSGESKIPSGFQALLPSETKINSLEIKDKLIKINFSKEILDIKTELEEKMIEAIVYTLTELEEIDSIIIYVDGDILNKLPKTGKILPSTLTRDFGINKNYNITSTKDIKHVTVYYLDKYNDDYYYVPVTKYMNDNRETIKIIIDELTSTNLTNTNLMSFLNSNTKLISYQELDNALQLEFNNFIFDDINKKIILEEVIHTISLSVADNYDVNEIIFTNEND